MSDSHQNLNEMLGAQDTVNSSLQNYIDQVPQQLIVEP